MTYRVMMTMGQMLSGRTGQTLEAAMMLVALEMNAPNTAISSVRIEQETTEAEVVFAAWRVDGRWTT
jgi:hypothetical protein